jgi:hypothetical protein
MSYFTPAEVAALRGVQEATFADVCGLRRPVTTVDGPTKRGSVVWQDAGSVACAAVSPSQAAASGLPILDVGSDERQVVFGLPVGTEVRQGSRIVWDGREFEVTSVQEPGSYAMQVIAIGLERS